MATTYNLDDDSLAALLNSFNTTRTLSPSEPVVRTSTLIAYDPSQYSIDGSPAELAGIGFSFDANGDPTGGTVNDIYSAETVPGPPGGSITGISLSLATLIDAAAAGQGAALLPSILSGNDTLSGVTETASGDTGLISGFGGNDVIIPGPADSVVNGGTGSNTVELNGLKSQAAIALLSPDDIVVRNLPTQSPSGAGSSVTLDDVQTLQFIDGSLWVDPDTSGGRAYALFQAALGRTPDTTALGYWADAVSHHGAATVASGLLGTAEAQSRLGALPNADFVSTLYTSVLGRSATAADLSYWTGTLQAGASRAAVLSDIAGSAEAQDRLAPTFAVGVSGASLAAQAIDRIWLATTGQLPSASSFTFDFGYLSGRPDNLVSLANDVASAYATDSTVDFIHQVQSNSYGAIDPGATTYFANQLAAGIGTRGDVVVAYASSPGIDIRLAPAVAAVGGLHT